MTATTAKTQKTNGKSLTPKVELEKTESQKEHPVVTLEKRIQKVQDLNIVIEKWRKLNDAKTNLNQFKLGNDGLSSTIIIKDSAGREFKTSQNIVFTTVLETVQKVLDDKIAETENQIDFAV